MTIQIIIITIVALATLGLFNFADARRMSTRFPNLPEGSYMDPVTFKGVWGLETTENGCRSCRYVDSILTCECFFTEPALVQGRFYEWTSLDVRECDNADTHDIAIQHKYNPIGLTCIKK